MATKERQALLKLLEDKARGGAPRQAHAEPPEIECDFEAMEALLQDAESQIDAEEPTFPK